MSSKLIWIIAGALFVTLLQGCERYEAVESKTGETIILDCNEMVKVIEVSYQWDDSDLVQLNCLPFTEEVLE